MPFTWRYEGTDNAGRDAPTGAPTSWSSRSDAESWAGEAWPELVAAGVGALQLVEDGTPVGPRVPLRPGGA